MGGYWSLLALLGACCLSLWPSARACEVGTYLQGAACVACPAHTNTSVLVPATSLHHCHCDPGFVCTFTRRVHATVTLNATLQEFQSNTNGVRSNFISGIASAAGVGPEKVTIHYVVIRLDHRRRRRRALLAVQARQSIIVNLTVQDAKALRDVERHLVGMHLRHTFRVSEDIRVVPAAQEPKQIA